MSNVIPAQTGRPLSVVGDPLTLLSSGSGDWTVFKLETSPGKGPPVHTHPWDETFIVTKGKLRLRNGTETSDFGPGGMCSIAAGVPHAYLGLESGTEAIVFFPSLRPLGFFTEMDGLTDMQTIVACAVKHGLTIAGPPLT